MGKFIVRRLLATLLILWGVSIVVFALIKIIPGDAAQILMGPSHDPELYATLSRSLGFDKPLYVQYALWLKNALQLDLGTSIQYKVPVTELVGQKAANSAILAAFAMVVALIIGFTLGLISALSRGTAIDALVRALSLVGITAPNYWLGLMVIYLFAVKLHWLPAGGMYDARDPGGLLDLLRHVILPGFMACFATLAVVARITRSSLLNVLGQPYILAARARGLPHKAILFRHGLRSIMVPVFSVWALQVGYVFGGALFVEIVFSWPGLGSLIYSAIGSQDVPVMQGVLLLVALVFTTASLFSDVLQATLDPRIRRPAQ
ncbi:MAG: ABC transporter permease [Chloroflexi bacterium]|nr:ABC transporter permease [Chloroflexota bacterium]